MGIYVFNMGLYISFMFKEKKIIKDSLIVLFLF